MPPPPTGNFTPTSVRHIGAALKGRATTYGLCSEDQFRTTCRDPEEVEPIAGDFDLLFVPGDETPDVRVIDGAGRTVNKRNRAAKLVLRTRLLLDPVGEDQAQWSDPDAGHIKLEDDACNAFELFQPVDSSGNWLVTEPLRLGRLGKPRKMKRFADWMLSEWDMEFSYVRELDNSIV